jgi:hypothetical protein
LTFLLTSLFLYIFTIRKCIVYHLLCRDGIYFDKILVSEYKLFKRSNKANPHRHNIAEILLKVSLNIITLLGSILTFIVVCFSCMHNENKVGNKPSRRNVLRSRSTDGCFPVKRKTSLKLTDDYRKPQIGEQTIQQSKDKQWSTKHSTKNLWNLLKSGNELWYPVRVGTSCCRIDSHGYFYSIKEKKDGLWLREKNAIRSLVSDIALKRFI